MSVLLFFFFFNDTATTEIYTLSLHDALPIFFGSPRAPGDELTLLVVRLDQRVLSGQILPERSEEHTSELQSQSNLVCRLLLEKKKTTRNTPLLPWRSPPPA